MDQSEADRLMAAESEKAWMEAFQGEIWGLGQSLINFDSASRHTKKLSGKNLAPSCSVSSIFKKIASFSEAEGCDNEVFKQRVKSIFKTESLSEAQENIVKQVTSISNNEAPSSINSGANICIPYTTFNFMKKGSSSFEEKSRSEDLAKAKKDIDQKCDTLVSDKIQPFFCSKQLPKADFNNFKRIIHPSVSSVQGSPRATDLGFKHFCSSENQASKTSEDQRIEENFSSAINLSEREVTDFEKFNSGIKTEYEKFNENVCSLLPKCSKNETKGECRNVISLRAMLIDNLKNKMPREGSGALIKLFARSPEKTKFDTEKFGGISQKEFDASSELLSYLNQFIINKADTLKNADGSVFLANKKSVSSKKEKVLNDSKPISDKPAKEKVEYIDNLFNSLEKRGKDSLSLASKDLDKIEDPKLLKSFVGGEIVKDPSLSPKEASASSVSAGSSSSSDTAIIPPTSNRENLRESNADKINRSIASRFANKSEKPRKAQGSNHKTSATKSGFKYSSPTKSSSTYKNNTPSPVGTRSFKKAEVLPRNNEDAQRVPERRNSFSGNSQSSFNRFKKAYSSYSGSNLSPGTESSSSITGQGNQPQADNQKTSEEFQNIETGKKGKGSSGTSKASATKDSEKEKANASGSGRGLVLGKDGKPIKGEIKTPLYVFDKIIPHVVIEKMGVTNVVLKYGLVGKRFNTIEIDKEDNFILHTFDFSTDGLAFEESYNNNQYNIVRIDILKQIAEIKKSDNDASATLKMLAGKTKNVKSDKIKYEITKEEIISKTIPPNEVESTLASSN